MSSLNFLDVNVWMALSWSRHSHAEGARAWFDTCEEDQFLFCRFTQLALLRLLTNKSVMEVGIGCMGNLRHLAR